MLERVARDQVIRGYFSDEEKDDDLRYSQIRGELFDTPGTFRRSTSFDYGPPGLAASNKTGTQDSMMVMAVDGERKASTDQTKVFHLGVP